MGWLTDSGSLATPSHAYLHKSSFVGLVLLAIVTLAPLGALLFLFLWIIIARAPSTTSKASLGRSAAVVVLGDVGRSPRMCFHAQSLADDGWRVALVGYRGTPPPPALRRSSVRHHYVVQPFSRLLGILPRTGGLFAVVAAPLKLIGQSTSLFWILATQVKPPPELIIVQTPPALPTLFVVRLVGMLLGSRLVIDWHNLGFSILQMRFKSTSLIVRLAYLLERWTGRRAFAHVCVTQALKQHLQNTWHVKGPVKVLYDRPPSHYRRASVVESHNLFSSLIPSLSPPINDWCTQAARGVSSQDNSRNSSNSNLRRSAEKSRDSANVSPFTRGDAQFAEWLSDRPALVVSSTSWTADEDFGMLLRAASMYEARARELNGHDAAHTARSNSPTLLESPLLDCHDHRLSLGWSSIESRRDKFRRPSFSTDSLPKAKRLPKMVLIVTGKGELRDHFLREIERVERDEEWQFVRIRTAWLAIEDYPTLLGSADVGVSLHSSSSGMDLPMKVVDMLGCGLTVCALGFPCVGELVQHGQNGLVFYSDKELATQLESLLAQHPEPNWLTLRAQPMPSLFPEDIPKSPPISTTSSPALGFSADGSRSSSPPPYPNGSEIGRPSSPLPMFTLLQSPLQSSFDVPSDPPSSTDGSQMRNWSSNWKRVIRPLITAADLEDERETRRELQQQPRSWFRGSQNNVVVSKLSTPRSSGEDDRLKDTPRDRAVGDPLRRRRMMYEGDTTLSPDSSPQRIASVRPQRVFQPEPMSFPSPATSAAPTPVLAGQSRFASGALQAPIDIVSPSSEASRIPGIHISAPTT